jgi:hypothetical protein
MNSQRKSGDEAFERIAVDVEFDDGTTLRRAIRTANLHPGAGISATVANRTHRVVRQRANVIRARRSLMRSLWAPLLVCAGLLLALCIAIWNALGQYETVPTDIPDASQQLLVLMMWSLPLSAALLALVWFRRTHARSGSGSPYDDEGDGTR